MTTDPIPPPIHNMGPYKVAEAIYLSPFSPSDTTELHRILNITNAVSLGLYGENMTFPFPLENAQAFTQWHLDRRTERRFVDCWAIRPSPEGPVIGLIGVNDFGHVEDGMDICYKTASTGLSDQTGEEAEVPMRCGKFGYWLSPEVTGQGIMTRVLDYVLRQLARQAIGLERVHGKAWEDNVASCRVMERVGMTREKSFPWYVPKFKETKMCAHYVLDLDTGRVSN